MMKGKAYIFYWKVSQSNFLSQLPHDVDSNGSIAPRFEFYPKELCPTPEKNFDFLFNVIHETEQKKNQVRPKYI